VSDLPLQIERDEAGDRPVLRLAGTCRLAEGDQLWDAVQKELGGGRAFELDLAGLTEIDGASAALLQSLRLDGLRRGVEFEFVEASPEATKMLELYDCAPDAQCGTSASRQPGLLDQIGRETMEIGSTLRDVFAFVGDLVESLRRSIRSSRSVNWSSVPKLMERAGADGVPIVLLINFLVGLILGLQAAFQLERFGANIFIADLVGLAMVREMAPLMTAIVVAGRSGAAYAAELGTMRVNQEVDALWTLGFDPQRYLVLPRIIALVGVVPLLTMLSMIVGIFGGLIVGVQRLGLTTLAYWVELQNAISLSDLLGGLFKSVVFAITIALIACQRGLATRGGAEGVGNSTTSAVVAILFFLVVLDALFTFVFNLFGI